MFRVIGGGVVCGLALYGLVKLVDKQIQLYKALQDKKTTPG